MNNKTIKTFLASIAIVLFGVGTTGASCTTICSHSIDGTYCTVILTQNSDSWHMDVSCLDGYEDTSDGEGQFGGTICQGTTPATCD